MQQYNGLITKKKMLDACSNSEHIDLIELTWSCLHKRNITGTANDSVFKNVLFLQENEIAILQNIARSVSSTDNSSKVMI